MAKSKNDERYFNFPIQLLKGFMIDDNKALCNICDYAIYENSLKLVLGESELENMKDSSKFFNVTLVSVKNSCENGKALYNSIPEKSPKVGLNLSIFWDFLSNDKSEFDRICLLGFLAIKSILQKNTYCKIDNKFWLSRMDGNPKSVNDFSELSKPIGQFANEYQSKKIKTSLQNNWGLVSYSRFTRGFYVSYSMSYKDLVLIAEKNRISTKEKQRKAKEKEIVKEVLEQLNRTRA